MAATFSSKDQFTPAIEASSSNSAVGIFSASETSNAIYGKSVSQNGVYGESATSEGVHGQSSTAAGVYGESYKLHGVVGVTEGQNVAGGFFRCVNFGGLAGLFHGPVTINPQTGDIPALKVTSKGPGKGSGIVFENTNPASTGQYPGQSYEVFSGSDGLLHFVNQFGYDCMTLDSKGNLKVSGYIQQNANIISSPEDPTNRSHSTVSSLERKNIYDGVTHLDSYGEAEVTLPSWFETLNADFRYQLTALGASAPNLYIAQKIQHNRFKIAGGIPGMEVSWLVTGIQQDALINPNPIPVEEDKPVAQNGR